MGVQNRLTEFFTKKKGDVLTVFYTAGCPELQDTAQIAIELEKSGVDIIEIGFPYSDSLVDGPTIQKSNDLALSNGMNLDTYFKQLKQARAETSLPFVYMGCMNPLIQYGFDRFLDACVDSGIDGLIVPDLPPEEFEEKYRAMFESRQLSLIFLITARTPLERIAYYDSLSDGFLYAVSSEATTGGKLSAEAVNNEYFVRLKALETKNPVLIGFGISDAESYSAACQVSSGAVIGSAFMRALDEEGELAQRISQFVAQIR
jgi:tryptophan synthase alpha chain